MSYYSYKPNYSADVLGRTEQNEKNAGLSVRGEEMPKDIEMEKMDEIIAKADAVTMRLDAFMAQRNLRKDQKRRARADAKLRMADARMAKAKKKIDAFEEARHPRNANGVFAPEGEEAKEKVEKEDTQIDPGSLSKRNLETT